MLAGIGKLMALWSNPVIPSRPQIRWIIKRDSDRVREIENAAGGKWRPNDLATSLRYRDSIGLVYEVDHFIQGFIIYRLSKKSIEIMKLVVDPNFQRKGIGSEIINRIKEKLLHRRTSLIVEVSETDIGAQIFLAKNGLKIVDRYQDIWDDGEIYKFEYCLAESEIRND